MSFVIKWKFLLLFSAITILTACNPAYETPDSPIDCGRQFINALYKGNFKRAGQLILQNDNNRKQLKETFEKSFRNRSSNEKEMLSQSSIVIHKIEKLGDNTTILHYQNAYENKPATVRVVSSGAGWYVDITP